MGQVTRTKFGIAKIVPIANAAVLTLPTADVELVAGVVGKVWLPQFISIYLTPRVADYTNIDAGATLTVRLANAANVTLGSAFTPATVLAGADNVRFIQQAEVTLVSDDFTFLNGAALNLHCTNAAAGNFTGGNVANILNVKVFYSAITL